MKTTLLKFVRNNLDRYGDVWVVNTDTLRPLKAMLVCQALNERALLVRKYNLIKSKR